MSSYGDKYRIIAADLSGFRYKITIQHQGWGGGVTDLTPDAAFYEDAAGRQATDDLTEPIRVTTCRFAIRDDQAVLAEIFDAGDREYRTRVERQRIDLDGAALGPYEDHWWGYLITDFYRDDPSALGGRVALEAIDGLSMLKHRAYEGVPFGDSGEWASEEGLHAALVRVLGGLGLPLGYEALMDWYPYVEAPAGPVEGPPLEQLLTQRENWRADEEVDVWMSQWDVLRDVLRRFQMTLMQSGGRWRLRQRAAKAEETSSRLYDPIGSDPLEQTPRYHEATCDSTITAESAVSSVACQDAPDPLVETYPAGPGTYRLDYVASVAVETEATGGSAFADASLSLRLEALSSDGQVLADVVEESDGAGVLEVAAPASTHELRLTLEVFAETEASVGSDPDATAEATAEARLRAYNLQRRHEGATSSVDASGYEALRGRPRTFRRRALQAHSTHVFGDAFDSLVSNPGFEEPLAPYPEGDDEGVVGNWGLREYGFDASHPEYGGLRLNRDDFDLTPGATQENIWLLCIRHDSALLSDRYRDIAAQRMKLRVDGTARRELALSFLGWINNSTGLFRPGVRLQVGGFFLQKRTARVTFDALRAEDGTLHVETIAPDAAVGTPIIPERATLPIWHTSDDVPEGQSVGQITLSEPALAGDDTLRGAISEDVAEPGNGEDTYVTYYVWSTTNAPVDLRELITSYETYAERKISTLLRTPAGVPVVGEDVVVSFGAHFGYSFSDLLFENFIVDDVGLAIETDGRPIKQSTSVASLGEGYTLEAASRLGDGPTSRATARLRLRTGDGSSAVDEITGGWKAGPYADGESSTERTIDELYAEMALRQRRRPLQVRGVTFVLRDGQNLLPHDVVEWKGLTWEIGSMRRQVGAAGEGRCGVELRELHLGSSGGITYGYAQAAEPSAGGTVNVVAGGSNESGTGPSGTIDWSEVLGKPPILSPPGSTHLTPLTSAHLASALGYTPADAADVTALEETRLDVTGTPNQISVTGGQGDLSEDRAIGLALPPDVTLQGSLTLETGGRIQGTGSGEVEVLSESGTNEGILRADRVIVNTLEVAEEIDQQNVNELAVADSAVLLNHGQAGAPTLNAAVIAERGSAPDAYMVEWDEGLDDIGTRLKGQSFHLIWHAGNDGAGSGLDADLWDGEQFAGYLDQPVRTGDSVGFAGLNVSGDARVSGSAQVDGDADVDGAVTVAGLLTAQADVQVEADVRTPDYVSRTTGWSVLQSGAADFRSIFAGELIVEAFTADVAQALVGSEIITKSRARLAETFVVPAPGDAGTLVVEDAEGAPGLPVFSDGDTIRLRVIDRSDGLVVLDVWGSAGGYVDETEGQRWTFTRLGSGTAVGVEATGGTLTAQEEGFTATWEAVVYGSDEAAGKEVFAGSVALDYGAPGDALIYATTLDEAGSPYTDYRTWHDDDSDGIPDRYETLTRAGVLSGIGAANTEGAGLYGQYVRLTEDLIVGDLALQEEYLRFANGELTVRGRLDVLDGQGESAGDAATLFAGLRTDTDDHEASITSLAGDIDDNEGALSLIDQRVTSAEGDIDDAETDISDLFGDVGAVEGDVTSLQSAQTTIENTLTENELTAQTNISSRVLSVEGDLSLAEGDISDLFGDVGDLEGDIGGLTTAQNDIEAILSNNQITVGTDITQRVLLAEGEIGSVAAAQTTIETTLDDNEIDAESAIGQRVTQNESALDLSVQHNDNGSYIELLAGPDGSEITLEADQIDVDGVVTFLNERPDTNVRPTGGTLTAEEGGFTATWEADGYSEGVRLDGGQLTGVIEDEGQSGFALDLVEGTFDLRSGTISEQVIIGGRGVPIGSLQQPPVHLWHFDKGLTDSLGGLAPTQATDVVIAEVPGRVLSGGSVELLESSQLDYPVALDGDFTVGFWAWDFKPTDTTREFLRLEAPGGDLRIRQGWNIDWRMQGTLADNGSWVHLVPLGDSTINLWVILRRTGDTLTLTVYNSAGERDSLSFTDPALGASFDQMRFGYELGLRYLDELFVLPYAAEIAEIDRIIESGAPLAHAPQQTVIGPGNIATGSVTADKIDTADLFAQSVEFTGQLLQSDPVTSQPLFEVTAGENRRVRIVGDDGSTKVLFDKVGNIEFDGMLKAGAETPLIVNADMVATINWMRVRVNDETRYLRLWRYDPETDPPPEPPDAPTNLSGFYTVSTQQISLDWDSSASTDYYVVEESVDGSSWGHILNTSDTSASVYRPQQSTAQIYYYRVKAVGFDGLESGYSNTESVTVPTDDIGIG